MTKHVSLRLTDELHRRLVVAANRSHRSLNGQVEWYVEQGVARDELVGKEIHHRDGDLHNNDPANLELRERPS